MASKEMKVQKKAKPKAEKRKSRFLREFWGEVKKLSWSSPKELTVNTLTVIAFVALFAVIIGALDALFGFGMSSLINIK